MDDIAALLDRASWSALDNLSIPSVEQLQIAARRRSRLHATANVAVVLVTVALLMVVFAGVGLAASDVTHVRGG